MYMKEGSTFDWNGWKWGFSPKNSFLEWHDSGSTDFGACWDPNFANFFGGAQDPILVQLTLLIQKLSKQNLWAHFQENHSNCTAMHHSALQCNALVTGPQWLKHGPKWPKMTDYAQGWHTRGQGGARGSGGRQGASCYAFQSCVS